jgi:transposase InsO family protein
MIAAVFEVKKEIPDEVISDGDLFALKLRDECLNGGIFYSLKEAQVVIEKWRVEYNTRRPHSALGYGPPAPAAYSSLVPPNPISHPLAVM